MKNSRIVIIGAGDAGISAAFAARKTNLKADITLITDEKIFYPHCPLPNVIAGEIDSFDLIVKPIDDIFRGSGIKTVIEKAVHIDIKSKSVKTDRGSYEYDSLILATGSKPTIPPIPGIDLKGVFTLNLENSIEISDRTPKSKKAVVMGGGAIGIEMAYALKKRGLDVTLVEMMNKLFPGAFDREYSELIEKEIKNHGIEVITGKPISSITGSETVDGVLLDNYKINTDLVILAVGIMPNVKIAKDAGIVTGNYGIKVNDRLMTSEGKVYACGDCTQSECIVTGYETNTGLGTIAERQGFIAGTNAAGGNLRFEGILNTMVTKIFDLEVGRTGITEKRARKLNIQTVVGQIKTKTKPDYYPGSGDIWLKLIFNVDKRLIGAQIMGYGNVSGYIDIASFAIKQKCGIEDLIDMRYCYAPPVSMSPHPLIIAAGNAMRKFNRIRK